VTHSLTGHPMSDTATAPVGARVRRYIVDNFLYMRPTFEFTDDDFLMGRGIIDSLGVMELIGFIEEEFGVSVADEDVTEENLGSINAIARYVDRARARR
jgi:acyl carrier protein